jgi:hypothetical protein
MTAADPDGPVRAETGFDYVRRVRRRIHFFSQADGRALQCAGPGHCRDCNREAGLET